MTLHEWLSAAGWFVAITAAAFVVLCWITSYARFERMTRQLEADHRAMDPHDAFQLAISNALGVAHRLPEPFCVLIARPSASAEKRDTAVETLRKSLRAEDEVFALSDHRLGLLIHARREHAEKIGVRLRAVWREAFPEESMSLAIGASSCPENGERVMELLSAAESALEQAKQDPQTGFALAPFSAQEAASSSPRPASPPVARYLDPLTGLLRPEHVGPAVQKYMAAHRRKDLPVSLLLIDVDHLDRYNSHYGREAGDAILKAIGHLIEKGFRETDLTARLSGEEFLVAVGCRPADALIAGQRLVAAVKRTPILFGREALRVTVKIGAAGFPDHGGHPRFLLEKADFALSVARERGGNTCVLYDRSMQPPPRRTQTDRF